MEEYFSHGGVECSGEVNEEESLWSLGGFTCLHEECCGECGKVGGLFGHASKLCVVEEVSCVQDDLLAEECVDAFCDAVAKEDGSERCGLVEVGVVFVKPDECGFLPLVWFVPCEKDFEKERVE